MSWEVANRCNKRKFGSASRKQVIMFLADKASDDGEGVYCSKHSIAKFTELSLATGYFDQAHFIRDFKQFAGITPGRFFQQAHQLNDQFVGS